MTIKTLAMVLGGTFFVCSGVAGLAACSSGGTGELPDMPAETTDGADASVATKAADAGARHADDAGTRGDEGDDEADATAPGRIVDAGAPDCGKLPFIPKADPTKGVRCPYATTDHKAVSCATGESCCVYNAKANKQSTCAPAGQACDGEDAGTAAFACAAPDDCGAGTVCCFKGQINVDDKMCTGNNIARGASSSACRATCAAGETTICGGASTDGGAASEGAEGKTCTPFSAKSIYMGACLTAQ